MFELDYWERVGLIIFAVSLLVLTAVIIACKLSPRCCLYHKCPFRARYDDEDTPLAPSIYTEYTPIPSHTRHLKESHPQFWSQLGSRDDVSKSELSEFRLKAIQKEISYSSSESEEPPKSPHPAPSTNRGKLEFSMSFNQNANRLILNVKRALDLPRRMVSGSYDVCIKVQLIGSIGKRARRKGRLTREQILNNMVVESQTKLQRRMQEIKFEENIEINLSKEQIRKHALRLVLCEYDKYSRMEMTGDILLPLVEQDLTREYLACKDFNEPPKDPKGEILLSFSHLPTAEKLSVVIIKLKDLKPPDNVAEVRGLYVKTTLIHRNRSLIRKKTSVTRFENNQTVSETLVYDIKGKQLKLVVLIAAVMCTVKPDLDESCDSDSSAVAANDVEIGRVIFGFDASGEALTHWMETVQSPRTAVARWHKLC